MLIVYHIQDGIVSTILYVHQSVEERNKNNRSKNMPRSCSYAYRTATKYMCIKFCGISERHVNLKYKYGNRYFWCRDYYVDTVGKNAKKIQEYIQNQIKEDLYYDQMTLKEYISVYGYKWDGSGNRGDDIYFNASINGEVFNLTVESYLCDKNSFVYRDVEEMEIGDMVNMEGFLFINKTKTLLFLTIKIPKFYAFRQ